MQYFTDDMSAYPQDYLPECGDTGDVVSSAMDYMQLCNLQGANVLYIPNMEDLFKARGNTQNILRSIEKMLHEIREGATKEELVKLLSTL